MQYCPLSHCLNLNDNNKINTWNVFITSVSRSVVVCITNLTSPPLLAISFKRNTVEVMLVVMLSIENSKVMMFKYNIKNMALLSGCLLLFHSTDPVFCSYLCNGGGGWRKGIVNHTKNNMLRNFWCLILSTMTWQIISYT